MTNKFYFAILLLTGLVLFSSCKRKGCTDPVATNYDSDAKKNCCCEYTPSLALKFNTTFEGQPFELNKEYIQSSSGRKLKFTKVKFYVSNVFLDNQGLANEANYGHFQYNSVETVFSAGSFPVGSYQNLHFQVGVDSVTNKQKLPSDFPSGHPLADSDMHWSWNTGYIFIKLEGMVDTTPVPDNTLDKIFLFHLGLDPIRKGISLNMPVTGNENDKDPIELAIQVRLEQFFNNIDLATENNTQTLDNLPLAEKMANNIPAVFSK